MRLFIDDERYPPDDGNIWVIVRDTATAIAYLEDGCPKFISFDHDLGDGLDAIAVVNWMIDKDLDEQGRFIPADFDFYVHSQNPVGVKNINSKLRQYLAQR